MADTLMNISHLGSVEESWKLMLDTYLHSKLKKNTVTATTTKFTLMKRLKNLTCINLIRTICISLSYESEDNRNKSKLPAINPPIENPSRLCFVSTSSNIVKSSLTCSTNKHGLYLVNPVGVSDKPWPQRSVKVGKQSWDDCKMLSESSQSFDCEEAREMYLSFPSPYRIR